MRGSLMRVGLPALVVLVAGQLLAQGLPDTEKPIKHVPVRVATRQELDRQEALRLYGLGLLQERRNKLLEATRTLEEARRLDPNSAPILKALIPLYLALDRGDDAFTACRRALELDPDDYDTSTLYARQLRSLDRRADAIAVLRQAVRSTKLKERPDLRLQIWADLGLLHEKSEEWAQALTCFRQAVAILEDPAPLLERKVFKRDEINTETAEAYERIGHLCLRLRRPAEAIPAFEKAQKKDPLRGPRLAYNLAQVQEGRGKFREALAQLEVYLRSQPQVTEGYELKIRLQRKLDREADILPDLESSSGRDPHNTPLRLLLAREYRRTGRADAAERVYEDLLKRTTSPDVFRGLFELYAEDARRGGERMLARLDESVEKVSGKDRKGGNATEAANARAMLQVLRGDARMVKMLIPAARDRLLAGRKMAYATRGMLATLAARTRQLEAAEDLYRSCLDQPGGPRESDQPDVYSGLLTVLMIRHKHEEAVKLCKQGLAKAHVTNRVMFHRGLAWAYLALDKVNLALEAANAMVNDAGEQQRLGARRLRAQVLSQAGKHTEAIAECQAMLKDYNQGSDLRDVRVAFSEVYAAAGQHEKAEQQLRLVLAADPDDALANNNLGYQLADQNKKLPEAERLIRKALELDRKQRSTGTSFGVDSEEDNAAYADSLGWVLFRRGDLVGARRELERAARLPGGNDDPVVWDHLGDVCFRQEERARAGVAWRKALSLYEAGARRRTDGRYKEIQEKLRLLKW
jgi:tetratricopeptide (TPR) repeat protein